MALLLPKTVRLQQAAISRRLGRFATPWAQDRYLKSHRFARRLAHHPKSSLLDDFAAPHGHLSMLHRLDLS